MDLTSEQIERIRRCWDFDTSSDPESWSSENPALGQCAVTACLVQDLVGGEIVWNMAICSDIGRDGRFSHYFNHTPTGIIDLTSEQFPRGTKIGKGIPRLLGFNTTRDYVLSYRSTFIRYKTLCDRFICLGG
jgi:hypothetical protein